MSFEDFEIGDLSFSEALDIISRYEDSIQRNPSERWTRYNLATGQISRARASREASYQDYAKKCVEYLFAGEGIERNLNGHSSRYDSVMFRKDTPQILQDLGCKNLPMLHTQAHLVREMAPKDSDLPHPHGLTVALIKEIPELLESPVIVAENLQRADGLVTVLDKTDPDGLPMLLAFNPDGSGFWRGQRIDSNFILTMFGKDGINLYLNNLAVSEKLLYVDNKKLVRLLRCAGHQSPRAYKSLNGIIRHYSPSTQAPQHTQNFNPNPQVRGQSGHSSPQLDESDKAFYAQMAAKATKDKAQTEPQQQEQTQVQQKAPQRPKPRSKPR